MKPVTLHLNTVAMRNTGHVGCSELIVLLFLNKRYDDRMRLIHRSCKSKFKGCLSFPRYRIVNDVERTHTVLGRITEGIP